MIDVFCFNSIYFCLFQAKLRLEMAAEHDKQMVHKELEAKDEEIEQFRFNMQKKVCSDFDSLSLPHTFFALWQISQPRVSCMRYDTY